MKATVRFANGIPDEQFDSVQSAVSRMLGRYSEGVCYDAGGFRRDEYSIDGEYDVRDGRVALIWPTEDLSQDDDGAHSVAEIVVAS